ncbi:glycosyltransferase [Mesorhizobium sp. M0496]|uniref:glycosyltransferase n=1 Tax=Mesorhizobium sp. M0496 TaxID=2956952 RepID=UPI00333AA72C
MNKHPSRETTRDATPVDRKAKPKAAKRTCIMVLGMHRSGTSALTRAISLLGAELPKNMLGANPTNEAGHWEPVRLMELHDRMLAEAGSRWDDWRSFDPVDLGAARLRFYKAEITKLIDEEYGSAPLFVLKDPRISRFVPLYADILKRMRVDVRCVLIQRNPLAVIASLDKRDRSTPGFGALLWLRHELEAERSTRGAPRVFVSYEGMMQGWRPSLDKITTALPVTWPRLIEEVADEVDAFISKDHQHHVASDDALFADKRIAEWVKDAYAALQALETDTGDAEAIAVLDRVRMEFDEQSAIYGSVFFSELGARLRAQSEKDAVHRRLEEEQNQEISGLTSQLASKDMKIAQELEESDRLRIETRNKSEEIQNLAQYNRIILESLDRYRSKNSNLLKRNAEIEGVVAVLGQKEVDLSRLMGSYSWKITRPLRVMARSVFTLRKIIRKKISLASFFGGKLHYSLRTFGGPATVRKIVDYARRYRGRWKDGDYFVNGLHPRGNVTDLAKFYPDEVHSYSTEIVVLRVLIVAEISIPQCKKYRVDQKVEMLKSLGIESLVVDWKELEKVRSALQLFSMAIFYRVPGTEGVINLINEAARLRVKTYWEVDDLIFDKELYKANKNLSRLRPEEVIGLLSGAALYREAMLACDESIASTPPLAQLMATATGRFAHVVPNALDHETRRFAEKALGGAGSREDAEDVVIVYGSGTKTHDADFAEAAEALLRIMSARPLVRLQIVGPLELDPRFSQFVDRVDRIEFIDFEEYIAVLSRCDIGIAPLEASYFNDAKSNIKYIEYSILKIPSVSSPAAAFRAAITDGDDGFLAVGAEQWEDKILRLIDNPALRRVMGQKAYQTTVERFNLEGVANSSLQPILQSYNAREAKFRILMVNIFFSPLSFGGATVVVEELARRIAEIDGNDVFILTSWSNESAPDGAIVRYKVGKVNVVAIKLSKVTEAIDDLSNKLVERAFVEVLKAVEPSVVHFHSIQGLGASLANLCAGQEIPFAVTLHDAWWICERQFMVTAKHEYCFQKKIDTAVCAVCVPDAHYNKVRAAFLRDALSKASMLLAPSGFFRELYAENGFDEKKIFVNKNGVNLPGSEFSRKPDSRIRFGYVGGNTPIKGFDLILKAFSSIDRDDVEFVAVDNTLNLGYQSVDLSRRGLKVPYRTVPAYTQATMDGFFSEVDVLLFPTQWKESFGLAVREALARDIWVIASDAGGVVEDIVENENGYIIPITRDYRVLKEAIERTIKMFAERRNLYSNPYKKRIQDFDSQANELLALLRNIGSPEGDLKGNYGPN